LQKYNEGNQYCTVVTVNLVCYFLLKACTCTLICIHFSVMGGSSVGIVIVVQERGSTYLQ
jgi:hypothetical protein